MTSDEYLRWILANYLVPTGDNSPAVQAGRALYPVIQNWAGRFLLEVTYSGSYAKGTATRGTTDVDLFISLDASLSDSLKDVYWSLFKFLRDSGMSPEARNVSVRVAYGTTSVDLVPGKQQPGNPGYHSLYRRRLDTWMQTNVTKHIETVRGSSRMDEIKIVKIWRRLHQLDFPSFYLELAVIRGLQGRWSGQLASNVLEALNYLSTCLVNDRILDPANTNNVVSDDLSLMDKQKVAAQAKLAASQPSWDRIVW
jgi:hypothetical protein